MADLKSLKVVDLNQLPAPVLKGKKGPTEKYLPLLNALADLEVGKAIELGPTTERERSLIRGSIYNFLEANGSGGLYKVRSRRVAYATYIWLEDIESNHNHKEDEHVQNQG